MSYLGHSLVLSYREEWLERFLGMLVIAAECEPARAQAAKGILAWADNGVAHRTRTVMVPCARHWGGAPPFKENREVLNKP